MSDQLCTCLSISRDPLCVYHGDVDKVRPVPEAPLPSEPPRAMRQCRGEGCPGCAWCRPELQDNWPSQEFDGHPDDAPIVFPPMETRLYQRAAEIGPTRGGSEKLMRDAAYELTQLRQALAESRQERDALISALPTDDPDGSRLVLNAYGRRCYDAGAARAEVQLAESQQALAEQHDHEACIKDMEQAFSESLEQALDRAEAAEAALATVQQERDELKARIANALTLMPLRLSEADAAKLGVPRGTTIKDPAARKVRLPKPDFAAGLNTQLRALQLPQGQPERTFHPTRKWRYDLCFFEQRVLVDLDGGAWLHRHGKTAHSHGQGKGFERDRAKDAAALLLGFTPPGLTS
jgi:very-short-patch-repair endonuclease